MGTKGFHQSSSLFVLCGVVVRLARRMGLQRDGTFLGLSPFETEIRRRLWWQVVHMDHRISDFAGMRQSLDLYYYTDTKVPSNVDDEDLFPEMTEPPKEKIKITKNALTLLRCEIQTVLCEFMPPSGIALPFDSLTNRAVTLEEKDKIIEQLEDRVETKFLRYCDPSIPIHQFLSIIVRSGLCKIKLFAHKPSQWADASTKIPQKERDLIFKLGIKLLRYIDLIYINPQLKVFMWQVR
jgi:hypothetical protein